jgi:hypothetical protein
MHNHVQTTSKITSHPHRIVHILLTDGHPTMGDSSESSLASLVDDTFSNVFIAYGLDHNPILMNKLGNAGKNTTNYLVKNLELIGHVYGEIVHNHLFKVLDNVVLDVVGGEGTIYTAGDNINISNNVITIGNGNLLNKAINCFYVVYGERCDVEKLVAEI